MLKRLPKTLYETYDRILANIPREHYKEVYATLQWLAFSARPMSLQEVAEAVVIEPGVFTLGPDDRLYQPEEILRICSSLVGISESGQELRLAHYSVKEYITSKEIQDGPLSRFSVSQVSANCLLGKVCLTYLLSFSKPEPLSHNDLQEYPLLNYAARHWFAHARFVPENSDPLLEDLSLQLFNPGKSSALRNWLWIYDPEDSSARRHSQRDIPPPLYYAAYLGLLGTTRKLLKNRVNSNAQNGRYGNALQAAAYGGHGAVVRLLVEKGLDVNIKGGEHGTALQAAAERGNKVMVLLLLEKGADVNANVNDGHFGTAIQAAAYEGHESVVSMLLKHGADVNASSGRYGNALQAAAYEGRHEVVQLLLDKGANPRASGGHFGTALQAAAYEGHLEVVRILLEKEQT
jgi:Ankyrin repeats (3 copies)/Ankyrin repeats (many copies)